MTYCYSFLTWFNWNELIMIHTTKHHYSERDGQNAFAVYHLIRRCMSARCWCVSAVCLCFSVYKFYLLLQIFFFVLLFIFVSELMFVWQSSLFLLAVRNVRNRQFYRKSASRSDGYFRIRVKQETGSTVSATFLTWHITNEHEWAVHLVALFE